MCNPTRHRLVNGLLGLTAFGLYDWAALQVVATDALTNVMAAAGSLAVLAVATKNVVHVMAACDLATAEARLHARLGDSKQAVAATEAERDSAHDALASIVDLTDWSDLAGVRAHAQQALAGSGYTGRLRAAHVALEEMEAEAHHLRGLLALHGIDPTADPEDEASAASTVDQHYGDTVRMLSGHQVTASCTREED